MSATGAVHLSAGVSRRAAPEVSVVMTCLNDVRSFGSSVEKAWEGIRRTGMAGEVVIGDNGPTDVRPSPLRDGLE